MSWIAEWSKLSTSDNKPINVPPVGSGRQFDAGVGILISRIKTLLIYTLNMSGAGQACKGYSLAGTRLFYFEGESLDLVHRYPD